MLSPRKLSEKLPFKEIAKASLEQPGMYLIALRAHLNRGKAMIGDVVDSVVDALPKTQKLSSPEN